MRNPSPSPPNTVGIATQSFSLRVDQRPQITSVNAASFETVTAGSFTLSSTGWPTPTVTLIERCPMASASAAAPSSAPAGRGTGGQYPLTVTAANGVSTCGN